MEVCNPIPLNCDMCFKLNVVYTNLINIQAGLDPDSTCYIWITDKFGRQFMTPVRVNSDGSFDIDTIHYPTGMFNASAGEFDLFVSSDVLGQNIVNMTFEGKIYSCLKLGSL